MCGHSVLADTARRQSSLRKVGYEWKAYSSELLWVAVKRCAQLNLYMFWRHGVALPPRSPAF